MNSLQQRSKLLSIITKNPLFFGKDEKYKNVIKKLLNNTVLDQHEQIIYWDMLYKIENIQVNN